MKREMKNGSEKNFLMFHSLKNYAGHKKQERTNKEKITWPSLHLDIKPGNTSIQDFFLVTQMVSV